METKGNYRHYFLIIILILAFAFRFYGINWDEGHHLHPDERMITMVAEGIHWPKDDKINFVTPLGSVGVVNPALLLSPQNPLNPKFFAYGSLPIYLLKLAGNFAGQFNPKYATYQNLNLVGRLLSILFELGTIIIIYKISKSMLHVTCYMLPALFYALSVLAIQTSHFYVVDVPLTFFITLTLYLLIKLTAKPSSKLAILIGISFGLALVSKLSALLLIVPILVTLLLIFAKKRNFSLIFSFLFVFLIFTFLFFIFLMPYALIDFPTFKAQTLEQFRMTKDAFTFPYTLQYVNTPPYLYQLKNMILWGMGIPLGVISIVGTVFVSLVVLKSLLFSVIPAKAGIYKNDSCHPELVSGSIYIDSKSILTSVRTLNNLSILLSFFWPYLLITGSFAIKFMRYWLPIYPLFCIFGGMLISQIAIFIHNESAKRKAQKSKPQRKAQKYFHLLLITYHLSLITCFVWPLSFLSIYSHPHTRVTASKWINENIPQGSTLAVEHWDDRLPLPIDKITHVYDFVHVELPLYEPDTEEKWHQITNKLYQTDYIIIASNRLYVPLMKLTDCQNLPAGRCYPKTAEYYQKLFSGQLGFTKVAEFTSYPVVSLFRYFVISFPDHSADESFTVYDHPKVMIFKKNPGLQ